MKILDTLHYLGNNDKKKLSVHAQYRRNHRRPNYMVHVSNSVTLYLAYFPPSEGQPTISIYLSIYPHTVKFSRKQTNSG